MATVYIPVSTATGQRSGRGSMITLEGAQPLVDKLKFLQDLQQSGHMQEAWERMTELVEMTVRDKAPYWLGYLRAGFDAESGVEGADFYGLVFSDVVYAPYQEQGTNPFFPNLDAIEDWAVAHGMTAWDLALIIAARGIIGLKFAEETLIQEEAAIVDLVGDAVAYIMSGGTP